MQPWQIRLLVASDARHLLQLRLAGPVQAQSELRYMQAHKYAPCSQAECTETHVAASARTCLMASFMPKTAKQHHAAKVGCRRALALGMASQPRSLSLRSVRQFPCWLARRRAGVGSEVQKTSQRHRCALRLGHLVIKAALRSGIVVKTIPPAHQAQNPLVQIKVSLTEVSYFG